MRFLVHMLILLGLAIAWSTGAQLAETPGASEVGQKVKGHNDKVMKFLDDQSKLMKGHKTELDRLAAEVEASHGDDPAAMMQLQFQMQRTQQQWEVTSTALQSLNEEYRTMARAIQGE